MSTRHATAQPLVLGPLVLDFPTREIRRPDHTFPMTDKEFHALRFLADRLNQVVTREELEQQVWGYAPGVRSHAVSVALRRLRAKLEANPKEPKTLLTVYGMGFRLCADESSDQDTSPIAPIALPVLYHAADRFHGRATEAQRLQEALATNSSLITVVGPGGVGKTRLVCETLFATQDGYKTPDKTAFCDLTNATDSASIGHCVAEYFNIHLGQDQPIEQLSRALQFNGIRILVLDNCEQCIEPLANLLDSWLQQLPALQCVLTSRLPLNHSREQLILLGPLHSPASEQSPDTDPALALFIDRANKVAPGFSPSSQELAKLEDIVGQLDRLPLAIELAASRMSLISIDRLHATLEQHLHQMRVVRHDRPQRHQSLSAVFQSSWDLLDSWEKATLIQLTAFSDGFTLEAGEEVLDLTAWPDAPWVIDVIHGLSQHGLIRPCATHQSFRAPRFRLLKTLHAQLHRLSPLQDLSPLQQQANDEASARHAQLFATFGQDDFLDGLHQNKGTARRNALTAELANLRAALRYAIAEQRVSEAVGCARAIVEVVLFHGPFDSGIQAVQDAQTGVSVSNEDAVRLRYDLGRLLQRTGDRQRAQSVLEEALALHPPTQAPGLRGRIARILGNIHRANGDSDTAFSLYQEGFKACRDQRDRLGEGLVQGDLGALYVSRYQLKEARDALIAALHLHREVGNQPSQATVYANLAGLSRAEGDLDAAVRAYDKAASLNQAVGNRREAAIGQINLGTIYRLRGELDRARTLQEQALTTLQEIGDRSYYSRGLGILAILVEELGELTEALALHQQAIALHIEIGNPASGAISLGHVGHLLNQLGQPVAAQKALEQAVERLMDLELTGPAAAFMSILALCQAQSGVHGKASTHIAQAEQLLRDSGLTHELVKCLARRAHIAQLQGNPSEAKTVLDEAEAISLAQSAGSPPEVARMLERTRALLEPSSQTHSPEA